MSLSLGRLLYSSLCFVLKVLVFLIIVEYLVIRFARLAEENNAEHYKEGKTTINFTSLTFGGSILTGFTVSVDKLRIDKPVTWTTYAETDYPRIKLSLPDFAYSITAPHVRTHSHLNNSESILISNNPQDNVDRNLRAYESLFHFIETVAPHCEFSINNLLVTSSYGNHLWYSLMHRVYNSVNGMVDISTYSFDSLSCTTTGTAPSGNAAVVELRNFTKQFTYNYTEEKLSTTIDDNNDNGGEFLQSLRTDTFNDNYAVRFIRPNRMYLEMNYQMNSIITTEQSYNPSNYELYRIIKKDISTYRMNLRGKNAAGTSVGAGNIHFQLQTFAAGTILKTEQYLLSMPYIQITNVRPSNFVNINSNIEEIISITFDNSSDGKVKGYVKIKGYDERFSVYQKPRAGGAHLHPDLSSVDLKGSKFSSWFDKPYGLLTELKLKLNYLNDKQQSCTVTGDFSEYLEKLFLGLVTDDDEPIEAMVTLETVIDESVGTEVDKSIEPLEAEAMGEEIVNSAIRPKEPVIVNEGSVEEIISIDPSGEPVLFSLPSSSIQEEEVTPTPPSSFTINDQRLETSTEPLSDS